MVLASTLEVRPQWLASRIEPIIEPALPIVDPHHHFWNRGGKPYFLPEWLEDVNSGHNIIATVFIECGALYKRDASDPFKPVGEVEFVNGLAAMSASGEYGETRVAAGIVGHADLSQGALVDEVLRAEVAAGGGRLRGVRHISAWHPDPAARASSANPPADLLLLPEFQAGLRRLARRGLTYDAFMYHTQLDELLSIARAVPEVTIVLNHVGGAIGIGPYAGKREEVFTAWSRAMTALAGCPNVTVKLGGLGMKLFGFTIHEGEQAPSSEMVADAWRPYIEHCIEAFGVSRCMFESNFPVDKGTCSYAVLWNAFKRIAAGASDDEKAALFCDTATRIYRL